MTVRIKRIAAFFAVLILSLIFEVGVSAESTVSLTLPDGFYVHSKEPQKTAEILGMTETELADYCQSGSIVYLAVDGENSRQIRVTVGENSFSNSVVNISELTDSKIESLAPEISGIDGVRGEAVELNGQKFLKVQLISNDSGGEYILTQYITVAQKQNIVLSFYTDSAIDNDYTEQVFESLSSPLFITAEDDQKTNTLLVIVPIVVIVFAILSVGIIISIIVDMKKHREEESTFEQQDCISKESEAQTDDETEED